MKKILFLLAFVPFMVNAQYINIDTLPSYPYGAVEYNGFTTILTPYAFSNFNGGVRTLDSTNSLISVTTTAINQGIQAGYTNKASTEYMLELDVLDPGTGIKVLSQWATTIDSIKTAGKFRLKFKSDATAGGFGNKVILASLTGATTFKVGFYLLSEKNPNYNIPYYEAVEDISLSQGALYGNSFNDNINGVLTFGITQPTKPVAGYMDLTTTTGGQVVSFGAGNFRDTMTFDAYIDIEIVTNPVVIVSVWGTGDKSGAQTISATGKYLLRFQRAGSQATSALNGLCMYGTSGTRIKVNSIKIVEVNANPYALLPTVTLGKNSTAVELGGGENLEYPVVMGYQASAGIAGVAIGDSAQISGYSYFGALQGGGEATAIGINAVAAGWRNTTVGGEAIAAGQSATAIGAGTEALTPHSLALGRGAMAGRYPHNSVIYETEGAMVTESHDLYLGNGWAGILPSPLNSDQSRGEPNATTAVRIHGVDAFDARYPQYSAGTTYSITHAVYDAGAVYTSLVNSNTGNTPASSPSQWKKIMDEPKGAAATFNQNAGDLELVAGRATGTGESGKVNIKVGMGNQGSNTKDLERIALQVKSQESISAGQTYVWIWDTQASTLKQVLVKKPASGTKGVVGFSRLAIN